MSGPDGKNANPPHPDEAPLDLAEVREARAFAESLAGRDEGPVSEDALDSAALLASARRLELDGDAQARLAADLFAEPARPRRRPALPWLAAAAALFLGVPAAMLLRAGTRDAAPASMASAPSDVGASPMRVQAESLVAALLPPGGSPRGRAEAMAAEARARLSGGQEATP